MTLNIRRDLNDSSPRNSGSFSPEALSWGLRCSGDTKAKLALSSGWAGSDFESQLFSLLTEAGGQHCLPQRLAGHASSDSPPPPTSTESPATFWDGRCLTGELTLGSFPQDGSQIPKPNQTDGFWQANKISKADLQRKTQISHPLISSREKRPWVSQVRTKYLKYSWNRDYFPLIILERIPVLVKERQRYNTKVLSPDHSGLSRCLEPHLVIRIPWG